MIQVDIRSRVPIYEQLYENIRRLILLGVMAEDEKVPSVRELASHLTINPNTIQKAYKALERDGYIYSVSGRGNFVKGLDPLQYKQETRDLIQKLNQVLEEAKLLTMSKEQVIAVVEDCYREGGNHDKN